MPVSSLLSSPAPPPDDAETYCEDNGSLLYCPSSERMKLESRFLEKYKLPKVEFKNDIFKVDRRSDHLLSSLFASSAKLGEPRLLSDRNSFSAWPICCYMLHVWNSTKLFLDGILMMLNLKRNENLEPFAKNPAWGDAAIRYFAWHPQSSALAVAFHNDNVMVYWPGKSVTPLLRHREQQDVFDVAWKPYSLGCLAVACQECIIIWSLDPDSLSTRPSSHACHVLEPRRGAISLAWHPSGIYLVSCSPNSNSISVWNDALKRLSEEVSRSGFSGYREVNFSPDGNHLMLASTKGKLHIYNCDTWRSETWSELHHHVQAACWSGDGSVFLFAMSDQPTIYSIHVSFDTQLDQYIYSEAQPLVDTAEVELQADGHCWQLGGLIQAICWDSRSQRLAVSFVEKREIALFCTRLEPVIMATPVGFICGEAGCTPSLMNFRGAFRDGALLAVAWSNNKLSYVPLIFNDRGPSVIH